MIRSPAILVCVLTVLFCSCMQETEKTDHSGGLLIRGKYLPRGPLTKQIEKLPYHLYRVKSSQQRPLLVLLHPTGSSGKDEMNHWMDEAAQQHWLLLSPTRLRHFEPKSNDVKNICELTKSVIRKYSIDQKAVYLAGHSSGAMIGSWVIDLCPEIWSRAVFISAPSLDQKFFMKKTFPPVLVIHGTKDSQYDIDAMRQKIELFKENGILIQLIEYDGSHEEGLEAKGEILDWLRNKIKS